MVTKKCSICLGRREIKTGYKTGNLVNFYTKCKGCNGTGFVERERFETCMNCVSFISSKTSPGHGTCKIITKIWLNEGDTCVHYENKSG